MKYLFFMLASTCAFTACQHSNKAIKERIANSDSIAINYFKGDGSMDTVVAVKFIRDRQAIEKLAEFISEKKVDGAYKCGYDGSLHFFKLNKVIQDIDFRMDVGKCMYFFFLQDGKPAATELSKDAKELINSFR